VQGLTGTAGDPLDAIRKVLTEDRYDRVIVSTLPRRASKWVRRDLPKRIAALGVPVEVVTPEANFIASFMPNTGNARPWDAGVSDDPRVRPRDCM